MKALLKVLTVIFFFMCTLSLIATTIEYRRVWPIAFIGFFVSGFALLWLFGSYNLWKWLGRIMLVVVVVAMIFYALESYQEWATYSIYDKWFFIIVVIIVLLELSVGVFLEIKKMTLREWWGSRHG